MVWEVLELRISLLTRTLFGSNSIINNFKLKIEAWILHYQEIIKILTNNIIRKTWSKTINLP